MTCFTANSCTKAVTSPSGVPEASICGLELVSKTRLCLTADT